MRYRNQRFIKFRTKFNEKWVNKTPPCTTKKNWRIPQVLPKYDITFNVRPHVWSTEAMFDDMAGRCHLSLGVAAMESTFLPSISWLRRPWSTRLLRCRHASFLIVWCCSCFAHGKNCKRTLQMSIANISAIQCSKKPVSTETWSS